MPLAFKDVLKQMLRQAEADPSFRKICLENPGQAYQAVANTALPPGLKLRFIESQADNCLVPLFDITPDRV